MPALPRDSLRIARAERLAAERRLAEDKARWVQILEQVRQLHEAVVQHLTRQ